MLIIIFGLKKVIMAIYTVNVLVNSSELKAYAKGKTSSWGSPIGGGKRFNKNVLMVATKDDDPEFVKIGDGDDFSLSVVPRDSIRWVIQEMDPVHEKPHDEHYSICLYGFHIPNESSWKQAMSIPNDVDRKTGAIFIEEGFNKEKEPKDQYLSFQSEEISVPQCRVADKPRFGAYQYFLKVLLVDTNKRRNPKPIAYIKIDPTINVESQK